MIEYVCGFAFGRTKRHRRPVVLLIRKARPPWQAGKLNGIGGKVEEGETALEAMEREFREETLVPQRLAWRCFAVLQSAGHVPGRSVSVARVYFYAAEDSVDILNAAARNTALAKEPCEVRSLRGQWVEEAVPNARWLVPMAQDRSVWASVEELYDNGSR